MVLDPELVAHARRAVRRRPRTQRGGDPRRLGGPVPRSTRHGGPDAATAPSGVGLSAPDLVPHARPRLRPRAPRDSAAAWSRSRRSTCSRASASWRSSAGPPSRGVRRPRPAPCLVPCAVAPRRAPVGARDRCPSPRREAPSCRAPRRSPIPRPPPAPAAVCRRRARRPPRHRSRPFLTRSRSRRPARRRARPPGGSRSPVSGTSDGRTSRVRGRSKVLGPRRLAGDGGLLRRSEIASGLEQACERIWVARRQFIQRPHHGGRLAQ